jgi:asparagine synthetase B (glutamine-hydrolysing)
MPLQQRISEGNHREFKIFTADLLRADKSTMAQGLETRVPFLDKDFLDVVMRINRGKAA